MSNNKMSVNLKSFSLKRKTPFEIEKERKEQKRKEEEAAAAAVYAEYIENFSQKASDGGKTFVRGETVVPSVLYDASEATTKRASAGELYTLSANKDAVNPVSLLPTEDEDTKPKKKDVKKKSNLELFKEQLKLEQEQREMKKAMKKLRTIGQNDDPQAVAATALAAAAVLGQNPALAAAVASTGSSLFADDPNPYASGSYAMGDTSTTNIYVGNLAPDVNEEMLCKIFGKFGPLASVKVMWPRTPEEKARGRNCGFVAFMARPDAEKAMAKLDNTNIGEFEVKLGWGKGIPIPPQPFYVHKSEDAPPDRPTGLPFNARPKEKKKEEPTVREYGMVAPPTALGSSESRDDKKKSEDDVLRDAEVIVVIPDDIEIRRLIHKMIEFVVREGPPFEAFIANREFHNPQFRFLLDYTSPEHVYYRWKLYSILQGDKPDSWPTERIRIYQGGPWWIPPKIKEEKPAEEEIKKGQLRSGDRDEFEEMLRNAAMDRESVKSAMGFCLDHCDAAEEIVECLSESLSILETPIPTKIARLFIVSDVLHNTAVSGASYYRRGFEQQLPTIFKHLNEAYRAISGRIRAEYFKKHVMNVLNTWDSWCLYPAPFLTTLKMTFLAVPPTLLPRAPATRASGEDIDGEDIDGEELAEDAEAIEVELPPEEQHTAKFKSSFSNASNDGDGEPLSDIAVSSSKWAPVGDTSESVKRVRIESKWESDGEGADEKGEGNDRDDASSHGGSKKQKIDSKWDTDEEDEKPKEAPQSKSKWRTVSSSDITSEEEETRRKMREIEVKVIEFREKLERLKLERSEIENKVDEYRKELVDKLI